MSRTMTSYDVMKYFNFFDKFEVCFHYEKIFFVANPRSMLNCQVYVFEKSKQSAIIISRPPTRRLLKTLCFLTKIAISEIFRYRQNKMAAILKYILPPF